MMLVNLNIVVVGFTTFAALGFGACCLSIYYFSGKLAKELRSSLVIILSLSN